jgi:hypothetical protein
MHTHSADVATTKTTTKPLGVRARRARWPLDGRTRESRKLRALVSDLSRQFHIAADDPLVARAAQLALAAEQARRQLIRNAPGASVEGLVKLENLARRAALDVSNKAHAKPNGEPDLQTYLRQIATDESANAISGSSDNDITTSSEAETLTSEAVAPADEAAQ